MFEEIKNVIDEEYNKIDAYDDNSEVTMNEIQRQVNEQNNKVENEHNNNSSLVDDFLKAHNKTNMSELNSEEISELLKIIDKEIENLEWNIR